LSTLAVSSCETRAFKDSAQFDRDLRPGYNHTTSGKEA
jgi:hypothetical protein